MNSKKKKQISPASVGAVPQSPASCFLGGRFLSRFVSQWGVISIASLLGFWLVSFASADRNGEPRPPIALEQPGDPPGLSPRSSVLAPSQQPRRLVRSAVTYSRGPWVSIQANVDEFGNNILDDAANEPSIAVDPNDPNIMAIGWRQFDTITSDFRQAGWGHSQDGGQSWSFPGVIEPGIFRSDPVLGFNSDGDFYYYSLTTDFNDLWECKVFKSLDGGMSWDEGVFAFGGDKAWLAVDRTGGTGHGHIYGKWQTFFNCCGQSTFTRSIDGGSSFEDPVPVPLGPSFGVLNVGPDGAVYVAGIWAVNFQNFDRIVIARSTDAQNPAVTPTFDLAVDVDLGGRLDIGAAPNPDGLAGQVGVATDHSGGPTHGNVYILASVDPPGSDPLDVMFIRSTDGGQNWSSPIRVNDDPGNSGAWQWFGTISVAPNGRIDVIWNDTRTAGQANISELFYAYSTDAGDTWSPNMPVSPAFDSHVGWPQQNKLGDYYDMISDLAGVRIAYAATFNGEQDVYYLRLGDCDDNGVHDGEEITGGASDDNANGILDLCESGACCLSDGTCAGELEETCLAVGGMYQGDGSTCEQAGCTAFGACCNGDGSCNADQEEVTCLTGGGMYQGDGSTCAQAGCTAFGACCMGDGTCNDQQTVVECAALGGIYQGDSTSCALLECDPIGACCLGNGDDIACFLLGEATCMVAQGAWAGVGTDCTDLDADGVADICEPQLGACCMSDFSCDESQTADQCRAAGGQYLGDGTSCSLCSPAAGACCDEITGECVGEFPASECANLGHEPQDPGTTCDSITCPVVIGACCLDDGSCLGDQTIADCEAAEGAFQGEDLSCGEAECPQPEGTGACCLAEGGCLANQTEAACTTVGGSYGGDNVSCPAAECPDPDPTGACCTNTSSCNEGQTAEDCAAAAGVYLGNGSDCTNCSPFPQACCVPDTGQCDDRPPSLCIAEGLDPQGEGTDCATDGCPAASGACCFESGFCLFVSNDDCSDLAGIWQGGGTLCSQADCGTTGACCLGDGSCLEVSSDACADLAGTYSGDGSTCGTTECGEPTGACCLAGGDCSDDQTAEACNAVGGAYQGDNSECAAAGCVAADGACCFATGFCLFLPEADCTDLAGSWQGPGLLCSAVDCGTTGACCLDSESCLDVTSKACATLSGLYAGDDTDCQSETCSNPCPPDFDGDGVVGPIDLATLLGAWGANPGSPADLDGDGVIGPIDLATLLGSWGPCP